MFSAWGTVQALTAELSGLPTVFVGGVVGGSATGAPPCPPSAPTSGRPTEGEKSDLPAGGSSGLLVLNI